MTHSKRSAVVAEGRIDFDRADALLAQTMDLLRSLLRSIQQLRQEVECWHEMLSDSLDLDPELMAQRPPVGKLESLIRECQKVEKTLVEQLRDARATDNDSGIGFDASAARAELMERLDRLQDAAGPTTIS